jgi:hypothetical protein
MPPAASPSSYVGETNVVAKVIAFASEKKHSGSTLKGLINYRETMP